MKLAFASILFALSLAAHAETVQDNTVGFSIDAPARAQVDRAATRDGSSVTVTFRDNADQETVVVRARLMTNGGKFEIPVSSVFTQIVAGMSASMGANLAAPIRTFSYEGRTYYVATHLNLRAGASGSKATTTVAYFSEEAASHKLILLQFITDANTALSDAELTDRFARLKYRPEN